MPFGSKDDSSSKYLQDLSKKLNDNMRRIRVLEETIRSLNLRTNDIEERLINEIKKINEITSRFDNTLSELTTKTSNIFIELDEIKKEMSKLVKRSEFKELETYIDLIKPMTSRYITEKELMAILREKGL